MAVFVKTATIRQWLATCFSFVINTFAWKIMITITTTPHCLLVSRSNSIVLILAIFILKVIATFTKPNPPFRVL